MIVLVIFFILGLIIGSFLNVVVCRLNLAESFLVGRSHCPHCKKNIRWYDNIPILSFIIFRFRCRDCKEKISWQYPLVELFTGFLFLLIGWKFFVLGSSLTWAVSVYYLGIVSFLMIIFVYDWLYMEIPGIVLWVAVGFAVAFNLFFDWSRIEIVGNVLGFSIYSGVLAAFVVFLFFFLLVAVSKEKWMGMGDAQLVILLGLVLGWPQILLALMLAFAFGAIIGLALVFLKKKEMKSRIPFAPFLVIGTFVMIFFYQDIVNWYLGLFRF
jgi:leader peptidase (prepilin peptidase)/N-methyltransferase